MNPRVIIGEFDRYLVERGLTFEAVIVGGAALALLDVISRETKDCDVLKPELPPAIAEAALGFATAMRVRGHVLADSWLNNGPSSLALELPADWALRTRPAFLGVALCLHTLGPADFLKSKLFALCDRAQDIGDCVALAPTADDLREALDWLEDRDANPEWPAHVRETLEDLARRLGHGL